MLRRDLAIGDHKLRRSHQWHDLGIVDVSIADLGWPQLLIDIRNVLKLIECKV